MGSKVGLRKRVWRSLVLIGLLRRIRSNDFVVGDNWRVKLGKGVLMKSRNLILGRKGEGKLIHNC
jgi:hypothetical protein